MTHLSDTRLEEHVLAIEDIDARIADLVEERRERYALLKAEGYCPRTTRHAIARRKQDPAARIEGDMLLETYERALNGEGVGIPDQREDLRELAIAILAEQIEGIEDPAQAALFAEHVTVRLDIRAEIAELRSMERARTALAVNDGFLKEPYTRVVRWIEKCAKHGADAMRAGEAVFHLYRGTVEGRGGAPSSAPVKFDPAAEKSAASKAKSKAAARTAAWLDTGKGD